MKLVLKPRIVRDRIGMGSIVDCRHAGADYHAAFVTRLVRDAGGRVLGVATWVDGETTERLFIEDEIVRVIV